MNLNEKERWRRIQSENKRSKKVEKKIRGKKREG